MANEFIAHRIAHAHLVHPGNASVTGNTTNTGIIIPKGALVTGVKMYTGNAVTGGASLSSAIFGISVGTVSIVSNNNVQSVKVLQTAIVPLTLAVGTDGLVIPATGELKVEYVSTGTAATGITCDFDLYVDYIFVQDHD